MPVPIVAIGLGMAGGAAFEYVTSGGRASKRDYAVSALVGGIPGAGLGARASLKGISKVSKLRRYSRKHGDVPADIPLALLSKGSAANIRPELTAIGVGVGANVVVGMAYDRITHSSSEEGRGGGPGGSPSSTTQSSRRHGPYSSHRSRRSASSGRRRKRCTHRDKRGRRCLRPAGHSGRHRYQ